MAEGLKKLLDEKKCFKLICGAGNQNLAEVEKLVALYAKAGCRFFDMSADVNVLAAAQKGLDFAIVKEEQKDYHFCISIGTKGDQHVQKARIDSEKCVGCGKCVEVCPQKAIRKMGNREWKIEIIEKNCIGCMKCKSACRVDAIALKEKTEKSHSLFPIPYSLSCIELHASDTDENEVDEIWGYLNENFDGMLSLCIGRQKLSDEKILARVNRLAKKRKPYSTIIQADGVPMSGGKDDFKTALPAIETGRLIQSMNLPVYLLLSGGTNSKTAELAKTQGVDIQGVAIGSYARKIVSQYIERGDFFTNQKIFNEAVRIAKGLIMSLETN